MAKEKKSPVTAQPPRTTVPSSSSRLLPVLSVVIALVAIGVLYLANKSGQTVTSESRRAQQYSTSTVSTDGESKTVKLLENGADVVTTTVVLRSSVVKAKLGDAPVLTDSERAAYTDAGVLPPAVIKWADAFSNLVLEAAWRVSPDHFKTFKTTPLPSIYTHLGRRVISWESFANGDNLHIVPHDFWFIWPTGELGSSVTLPPDLIDAESPVSIETLHAAPRLFHIRNFLSHDECDELINVALSITTESHKLKRSTTGVSSAAVQNSMRTSDNAFDKESPVAKRLMKRIFQLIRMPHNLTHADGVQIVRYRKLQAYSSHHDYFPVVPPPPAHAVLPPDALPYQNYDPTTGGSNRFATLFVYLSTVEEGGQTVFPSADKSKAKLVHIDPNAVVPEGGSRVPSKHVGAYEPWLNSLVSSCYDGVSVPARKGDAVLFYSQLPSKALDPLSLHGGCPVLSDEVKWGANLWVWNSKRAGYSDPRPVRLSIANPLDVEVQILYERKPWGKLAPHTSTSLTTYDTHAWGLTADGYEPRYWRLTIAGGTEQSVSADLVPLAGTAAAEKSGGDTGAASASSSSSPPGVANDGRVVLIFVNQLPEAAKLFWVPPNGASNTQISTLPAGAASTVYSFEGHSLLVEFANGLPPPRKISVTAGYRDPTDGVSQATLNSLKAQHSLIVLRPDPSGAAVQPPRPISGARGNSL